MQFSIVIPAYNEEGSIESIIKRCLAIKRKIIQQTFITQVEVIVVSDGSTDLTNSKAKKFVPRIKLIGYKKNKGYGRALKIGFENSRGQIVGFLDADGTCDPFYFINMLKSLKKQKADICLGSRMGPDSQMPFVRQIGNRLFRFIINSISSTNITDVASGMRVIRKDKLNQVYPLPNGLNFTPAMTCRAVLDADLKIVEIEMAYREREGKSKLHVFKDGIGFLKAIMLIAITYKPLRILAPLGFLLITVSSLYGGASLIFYLKNGFVPEDEIYRLISVMVFGVAGALLLGLASLADKAAKLLNRRKNGGAKIGNLIRGFFSWRWLWLFSPLLFLAGISLNYQSIISWFTTRTISIHWAYIVFGGYLVLLAIVGFTLGIIDYFFDLIKEKGQQLKES